MLRLWRYVLVIPFLIACDDQGDDTAYVPSPANLDVPALFQQLLGDPLIPQSNPLTEEGIALGQRLFFDRALSADGTQSCASCHRPQAAFSDNRQFSIGINGTPGTRNSMPLHNLAWNRNTFNWDGSASSLEEQAFEPVTNPIEMNNTWTNVVETLENLANYPRQFEEAFGTPGIDSVRVTKALSQFTRTLISGNSRFDRFLMGELELTDSETNGFQVFMSEDRGDCFHCHGNENNPLWTDNDFHNNGLDKVITDRGLGAVTGDPREFGLFRTPTLRNLSFTAPYMHDGRFETLDEVIDHYSEGLVFSETIDPLMKAVDQGGVQLSDQDKADLKAFLLALSDPDFIVPPNNTNSAN